MHPSVPSQPEFLHVVDRSHDVISAPGLFTICCNSFFGSERSPFGLKAAIRNYLALRLDFCWRNNSGAFKTEHGSFVRAGLPLSPTSSAASMVRSSGLKSKPEREARGQCHCTDGGHEQRIDQRYRDYLIQPWRLWRGRSPKVRSRRDHR
jgi:hypothetical protein